GRAVIPAEDVGALLGDSAADATWTAYRGNRGDGVYSAQPLLDSWPDQGPACLWRQPIGGGYASFAVAAGRAVTIEQRRAMEAVVAYDVATGRELWAHEYPARFTEPLGGEGPRATPLIAHAMARPLVVALGATGHLTCLDLASGSSVWHRNVLEDAAAGNLTYGLTASPILVDGQVIVLTGAPGSPQLVHAFRIDDGEPIWSALSDDGSYATPMHARLAGRDQLIVASASRVVGLDASDGALLWDFPWSVMVGLTLSQPIVIESRRVLLSGGYGKGSVLIEIEASDGAFEAREVWRSIRLKAKFNSPVAHNGHAYGLDEGTLVCLDLETGERLWKGGRFGYGQTLLAGERLIVVSESGELALVAVTPDGYDELCRFQAISGTTWNNPAFASGKLLIRNAVEMACFDLRQP
ncbi:MAG: outer membrane protein assembly factor BamB, partial [Gammaproteobacteria bacterium]